MKNKTEILAQLQEKINAAFSEAEAELKQEAEA
jgi:hypothetical protein